MTTSHWRSTAIVALAGTMATAAFSLPRSDVPPRALANDNRTPAGRLRDGVLRLSLDIRTGRWYPEADDGPFIETPLFAETGRDPVVPAPLIRVPAGTIIEVTVRNALPDSTVTVRGLMTRPAAAVDSFRIAPGQSQTVRFTAGAPGTYLYGANAGVYSEDFERNVLAGAFIVDSTGAASNDRVFVMNVWGEEVGDDYRNAVTINGKAWPHTERFAFTVGDTVRWRWINATIRPHPMHLHGFYFRVDARGTPLRDSVYSTAQQRQAVTEELLPFTTAAITWSPNRPGNWLFHCHIAFHVVTEAARFDPHPRGDPHEHMAGLVLGLSVRAPRGWRDPPRPGPRTLRFLIDELPRHRDTLRTVGVSISDAGMAAAPSRSPGPTLFVTRNQPTDVVVVNRLAETASIHWHGLELESYSDGVARWSGAVGRLAPAIAPGDSFIAHLTMPRAGTFIYHTHLNDVSQLTGGLYGAIVVLPPGAPFDSTTDHVFTIGWDGRAPPVPIVVNGERDPAPLELAAGRAHRLRFVNIGPGQRLRVMVARDSTPVLWRLVAKDGMDLAPAQILDRPARELIRVGETFDAVVTLEPGDYVLSLTIPLGNIVAHRRTLHVR
jgi:FtsP/CotA-like multicopper oxidase with cupredoxin domain